MSRECDPGARWGIFLASWWSLECQAQPLISLLCRESLALVLAVPAPAPAAPRPARGPRGAHASESLLLLSMPAPGHLCPLRP
uniref:Cyclooxygenase 1b1 n=1 Tax=Homo sapiens TaxID=9606 RepID=Q3HY30_HUMAN|nr:cyclooxygenase 1b1 [Homo sapiens]